MLFITAYSLVITHFLPVSIINSASQAQLPFSFCGSAIGLLLVFRTNNAYTRLNEARELWAYLSQVAHEIASLVASSEVTGAAKGSDARLEAASATPVLDGPSSASDRPLKGFGMTTRDVVDVHRYLVAFVWALRDELREDNARDDVLRLLVLDEKEERWIASSPSRPKAIINRLRRRLHDTWHRHGVADHTIFLLDGLVTLPHMSPACRRRRAIC